MRLTFRADLLLARPTFNKTLKPTFPERDSQLLRPTYFQRDLLSARNLELLQSWQWTWEVEGDDVDKERGLGGDSGEGWGR